MRLIAVAALLAVFFAAVFGYPNNDRKSILKPEDHEQLHKKEENLDDDSDMYMEALEQEEVHDHSPSIQVQAQTFYPSFSPFQNHPSGHSRPFYYQQEAAYSHRPTGYQGQQFGFDSVPRFSGYKDINRASESANADLLGSGNFGVIRGGTFYDDEDRDHSGYEDRYNPYYYNGHGRPALFRGNPRPTQHEQFANFRDFADINTPSSPAYSHYVVVYANSNGTHPEIIKDPSHKPRNILEQLAMLDEESASEKPKEEVPAKKLSKSKRKLALLQLEKKKYSAKSKTQSPKDLYEPLLALS